MAMPFGVTYWPSGMINQITYANGTTSSYTQTPRLWPATFTTAKTGGATYLNSAYTYDGTGNLATIRDSVESSFNRTLGYDGINRLTSAAGFWGAGSISYDSVDVISRLPQAAAEAATRGDHRYKLTLFKRSVFLATIQHLLDGFADVLIQSFEQLLPYGIAQARIAKA